MKQTDLNLELTNRRTRKRAFLDEMEHVVPWKELPLHSGHSPPHESPTK
jgi:transposase, IS5 family